MCLRQRRAFPAKTSCCRGPLKEHSQEGPTGDRVTDRTEGEGAGRLPQRQVRLLFLSSKGGQFGVWEECNPNGAERLPPPTVSLGYAKGRNGSFKVWWGGGSHPLWA